MTRRNRLAGLMLGFALVTAGCASTVEPESASNDPEPSVSATSPPATSKPAATERATSAPPASPTAAPTATAAASTSETDNDDEPTPTAAPTSTPEPIGWNGTGCVAPPRQDPPDNLPSYDADLVIDPEGGVVSGQVQIGFSPDLATDRIVLRLWANGPREAARGVTATVGSVSIDGQPVEPLEPDPTTLELELGRTLAAGDDVTINVVFGLTATEAAKARVSGGGDWMRLGSVIPLLAWEPGVGWAQEPGTALFAEAVSSPVADWDVTVSVPDGFGVLASGMPERDQWTGEHPNSVLWEADGVRDFALSVGRFNVVETTINAPDPVRIVVGAQQDSNGDSIDDEAAYLTRISDALEDFAGRYGGYPWPTLTMALTPETTGGIEFPTHIMQGPGSIGRTTPHEVAHMFFYSLVGNNQGRDPWMDEGLASWAEFTHEGNNIGALTYPSDQLGASGQPITYHEQRPSNYYDAVYVQPAVALGNLGSAAEVDCALRIYVAQNAWETATPKDLFAALDEVFDEPDALMAVYGLQR